MVDLQSLSSRLVTVPEAAELLHVREQTLQNWLSLGRYGLRRIKMGRKTFCDRAVIEGILLEALEG